MITENESRKAIENFLQCGSVYDRDRKEYERRIAKQGIQVARARLAAVADPYNDLPPAA